MASEEVERIKLERAGRRRNLTSGDDRRPRIPEPLPVRLIAVHDARLPATAGLEHELDRLYADVLRFERDPGEAEIVYRAENFRLRFEIVEGPIHRDDYRPLGIEVPSLNEVENRLFHAEINYERQRGLLAGWDGLSLMDAAGNWLEIIEMREVR